MASMNELHALPIITHSYPSSPILTFSSAFRGEERSAADGAVRNKDAEEQVGEDAADQRHL